MLAHTFGTVGVEALFAAGCPALKQRPGHWHVKCRRSTAPAALITTALLALTATTGPISSYARSSSEGDEVDSPSDVLGVDGTDDGGLGSGGPSSCWPQPHGHTCREKKNCRKL